MRAANSAAQVSTVWYTGRMPNACRSSRTWSSGRPCELADLGVGEPGRAWPPQRGGVQFRTGPPGRGHAGGSREPLGDLLDPLDLVHEPGIDPGHPGHVGHGRPGPQRLVHGGHPAVVRHRAARQQLSRGRPAAAAQLNGAARFSSERSAFCSASGKLRPMAMASPTDFMCVVSSGSAPGNFSNANRGTLTTT